MAVAQVELGIDDVGLVLLDRALVLVDEIALILGSLPGDRILG